MPWVIAKKEDEFCVYKKGADGGPMGESLGCHATESEAEAQLAALYANEPGAKSIKAIGDWELEVLGCPYFGPDNGRDADGEYFSPETKFHEDKYPLPPVVYYHGFDPDGRPSGNPQYIGRTVSRERRDDGVWYRVVLDKASEYAKRVWDAAKQGLARASSGAVSHLVRRGNDGHLLEWPVAELSIFDAVEGRRPANGYAVAMPVLKAVYQAAGLPLPDIAEPEPTDGGGEEPHRDDGARQEANSTVDESTMRIGEMDEEKIQEIVAAAIKADREKREAEEAERKEKEALEALKAENEALKAEAAKNRRLPSEAPYVTKFNDTKYDNLDAADMAWMVGVLDSSARGWRSKDSRETALKSLLAKAQPDFDHDEAINRSLKALYQRAGKAIKSDEIHQQDLTDHGDEWVGVMYSNQLWEAIRASTFVVDRLPKIEVPAGHESIVIPLESSDVTYYKVAEAEDLPTTEATGWPNATISSSQITTDNQTLSLAKMGARALWSGELEEDSLIPFANQLRMQMQKAGAEQLEHVIIDGDTDTTASTNINDIAGTPAGTEAFLLVNGFRKLALVTNTNNARSGTTLTEDDYLETLKLMGTAGLNAADISKVTLIPDANVYWKSLQLASLKTKDVWTNATLESGQLARIWGYEVKPSWLMHYKSAVRKANSSGKIDLDTTTNNSTGSILAVRWDQWLFGWRRRMTMETTRIARADTTEIVALMRFGLTYRDTEASAISYNITV